MKLAYKLTLADVKAAFRLHRRQTLVRRCGWLFWIVLTVACFTVAHFASVPSELFAQSSSIGMGALVIAVGLPISRFYNVRKCYRQHFPKARTGELTTTEIDDEQIVGVIPGVSETKRPWKAIVAFAQDNEVTLFYVRKSAFVFLPTSAMSPAQRSELDDLVARHLPKGKP
jgi:hypothetical protein